MKTAMILFARDKIHGIHAAVNSVLGQTYSPMELIISDHGSTDGTREAIHDLCSKYDGPNTVRLLDCPKQEFKGMAGLNTHIDWIMSQTDADFVVSSSSDDVSDVTRVEKVVRGWQDTGASMVGHAMQFMKDDGSSLFTGYPKQNQFVTGDEMLDRLVGGSTNHGWTHEFYDRCGGLHGIICPDVYMPYLATLDKGFYYLHECLYCIMRHSDAKNTGLMGVRDAAETDDEKLAVQEMVQFQLVETFSQISKAGDAIYGTNWKPAERSKLFAYLMGTAQYWSEIRAEMTMKRLKPMSMPV